MGCNRCIRVCPIVEANVAYVENGRNKVRVDNNQCIACGACMHICHHGSRSYEDDTERFFDDLRKGVPISLFCAPAARANLGEWDRILAWLQQLGVRKIYDVSMGADICVWGYIRYIQKNKTTSLITQPCPAIVDYILLHHNELLPYLSPVQSPMLCTAIYMKKYMGITDKLAAISPCIAKINEFEENGNTVSYNVTFFMLEEYIKRNNIKLPEKGRGYDHIDSSLGSVFSMPGGLKENVEFILGKELRVDKCEGQNVVYKALNIFSQEDKINLPAIFDVLNCGEGCNKGSGCNHDKTMFEIDAAMDRARKNAISGRGKEYFEQLYQQYDNTLNLNDFIRRYRATPVRNVTIGDADIEEAFKSLGKYDQENRNYNCGACGSDTCFEMAIKIAKKVNIPENCIKKAHDIMRDENSTIMNLQSESIKSIETFKTDITEIKKMSDGIVVTVSGVDNLINLYDTMAKDIDRIATNVHMISLNASIEAVHAGDRGRAFAVVANSIRTLASETQDATSKITNATHEAKSALGNIARMVTTISSDISKSLNNVNEIYNRTKALMNRHVTK
jgi:iron only hydrogenase large subunit-like protein